MSQFGGPDPHDSPKWDTWVAQGLTEDEMRAQMLEEQREDLIRKIEERREDREFMARLRRIVAENRDVLDRLAEGGD